MSGEGPVIVTERLELHRPKVADIAAMHAIVSDPATGRFLGPAEDLPAHATRFLRGAGSWYLYGYGPFMVRDRETGDLLGNCGVFHSFRGLGADFDDNPEAGWIIGSAHVGRGIGREAMDAALAWFEREHGARRIVAMVAPGNAPSIRLAEKLGFKVLRDATLPEGEAVCLFERLPAVSS